jgi:hypothetical protein
MPRRHLYKRLLQYNAARLRWEADTDRPDRRGVSLVRSRRRRVDRSGRIADQGRPQLVLAARSDTSRASCGSARETRHGFHTGRTGRRDDGSTSSATGSRRCRSASPPPRARRCTGVRVVRLVIGTKQELPLGTATRHEQEAAREHGARRRHAAEQQHVPCQSPAPKESGRCGPLWPSSGYCRPADGRRFRTRFDAADPGRRWCRARSTADLSVLESTGACASSPVRAHRTQWR